MNDVNGLIDQIYATAVDAENWEQTLGRVADQAGYAIATLATANRKDRTSTAVATHGIDLAACIEAESRWGLTFLYSVIQGRDLQPGEWAWRHAFMNNADFRKEPYYKPFIEPNGLLDGAVICLENSPSQTVVLHLGRSTDALSEEERAAVLSTIAPHCMRATQVFLDRSRSGSQRVAYSTMANLLPYPLVMLDRDGNVFLCNSRAEPLLRGNDLQLRHGRLRASITSEDRRLQQAVRAAVSPMHSVTSASGGTYLSVNRAGGKHPYRLVLSRLPVPHTADNQQPVAAMVIFDPEREFSIPTERLHEIFGFTRAEANVAIGIMQGKSLAQIATSHGTSVATSRNLLKRVFLKAGVNRQSELTIVLLNSPLSMELARRDGVGDGPDAPA